MNYCLLLLLPLLLVACTAPAPPPPAPSPSPPPPPYGPRIFIAPQAFFFFSQAQADSVARRFGCISSFSSEVNDENVRAIWPRRLPGSKRFLSLRPGRVPGLRVQLHTDSLKGYLPEPPPEELCFITQYPVFSGSRASRPLRQLVDQHFILKAEIAAIRRGYRGRLYSAAAPPPDIAEEDGYHYRKDEQQEFCDALSAYALPHSDTLITTAYTHYYTGIGGGPNYSRGTLCFSLGRQREVEAADLFQPDLMRALDYVATAQELIELSWEYAQDRWVKREHPFQELLRDDKFWEPGHFFAQWQQQNRYKTRLTDAVQQLQASMSRREAVPESVSNLTTMPFGDLTTEDNGQQFYFMSQGVVFCLGYGILEWEVLVPYAELPRYLLPASGERSVR